MKSGEIYSSLRSLLSSFLSFDMAVDFGSEQMRIFVKDKGLVIKEPTVVARQKGKVKRRFSTAKNKQEVLAVGTKAYRMLGKQPKNIEVVRPISRGVVVDFDAAFYFVDYFFSLIREIPHRFPRLVGPRVIVGVPSSATEVERRAVKSLLERAGAREVFLVEKPLLAAAGSGLDLGKSKGIFLVDLGGGTSEIAVISLGGIVVGRCLGIGGLKADERIVNFLRLKYGVVVGYQSAHRLKEEAGSLIPGNKERSMVIRGRDLGSGLPKSLRVREAEVREALAPLAQEIVAAAKEVLEESPPELTQDFLQQGVVLTGGFARLDGFDKLVSQELGIPAWLSPSPQLATVKGAAKLLDNPSLLRRVRLVAGLK